MRFSINNVIQDNENRPSGPTRMESGVLNPAGILKILFVDDKANVRSFVGPAITAAGYQYLEAADGPTALFLVEEEQPDLVILDIMLEDPDFGGLDICKEIRSRGNQIPVIFLTVKDRAEDPRYLQRAFSLGGDDYITKREELLQIENSMGIQPTEYLESKSDVEELLARIQARLPSARLIAAESGEQIFGDSLHVDFDTGLVRVRRASGWEEETLTLTELEILKLLADRRNRPVGRIQIVDTVDREGTMTERSLESHIHRLRQKVATRPAQPGLHHYRSAHRLPIADSRIGGQVANRHR